MVIAMIGSTNRVSRGARQFLQVAGGCFLAWYFYGNMGKSLDTSSGPSVVNNIYLGAQKEFSELEEKIQIYSNASAAHESTGENKPASWYEEGMKVMDTLSSRLEEYIGRVQTTKEQLTHAYEELPVAKKDIQQNTRSAGESTEPERDQKADYEIQKEARIREP